MNAREVKARHGTDVIAGDRVQVTWSGGNGPHWYHVVESYNALYLVTPWELYHHDRPLSASQLFQDVETIHTVAERG